MVALGGGVIGDTVGFAASIYQRGIDFIQIPTTLLAQVDSSVGGKTAVNHPLGKNMIGAFHQPRGVWMELQYLETLPEREWRAGLAEVIKIALVADGSFFAWLEDNHAGILAREPILIERMIARSIELKADIVVQDTFDRGVRAYVNLGHTFGHAIEHVLGYGVWLHGEAVGLGLRMACDASQYLKAFPASLSKRVHELLDNWQLPKCLPKATAPHDLLQAMRLDKKNDDRGLRFVLLKDMEDPCVETVDNEAYLIELIASYQS
jgi:3-dehydroquinate synthase